jgi:hypothetical protein
MARASKNGAIERHATARSVTGAIGGGHQELQRRVIVGHLAERPHGHAAAPDSVATQRIVIHSATLGVTALPRPAIFWPFLPSRM